MLRVKYPRGQRPSWDWTTRQLRDYIKEKTRIVNKEYGEFMETTTFSSFDKMFKPRISELQKQAGVKSRKETIGLGLKYKHKDELVAQALELYRFQKFDVYSPGGREREKKRKIKEYVRSTHNTPEGYEYETFINLEPDDISIEFFTPKIEDYEYNPNQPEWHEGLKERESRTREEISRDAYDLARPEDRKKFDKFQKNHPDIDLSFDEWEQMVIFAGGAGSIIAEAKGSEQIVSLTEQRTREGRLSLYETFDQAMFRLKGQPQEIDIEKVIDEMAAVSAEYKELTNKPI